VQFDLSDFDISPFSAQSSDLADKVSVVVDQTKQKIDLDSMDTVDIGLSDEVKDITINDDLQKNDTVEPEIHLNSGEIYYLLAEDMQLINCSGCNCSVCECEDVNCFDPVEAESGLQALTLQSSLENEKEEIILNEPACPLCLYDLQGLVCHNGSLNQVLSLIFIIFLCIDSFNQGHYISYTRDYKVSISDGSVYSRWLRFPTDTVYCYK
jgi:hypothetical protein